VSELEQAYETLAAWCRSRGWAGHDPFDGLNSRVFQATPLKESRLARLAWTQAFKRAPVSLRTPARVPVGRNAKGTALFALAALSRFRATGVDAAEREARELLDALLAARLAGGSGAAWGYNFDWQGRAFFAPRGTPTIVPTAFAVRALVEAHRAFGDEQQYLPPARSACDFILRDLKRSEEGADEICFSYTPLDETRVFNASLLAGEALASVGARTGEEELLTASARAARYVVRRQRADGSWAYGAAGFQGWADNFHTAFILMSLARISEACGAAGAEFSAPLRRGYEFWRGNFFLADGWPKYYHDNPYPADAHSSGAAVVALVELKDRMPDALALADRIINWTLENLRDPRRGFFYYQRRRFYTIRTPYMRWTQAWMMYALARRMEVNSKQ